MSAILAHAGLLAGSAEAFNPASVFGVGDQGVVFSMREAENLALATNGTSPVTAFGERAAYAADLSGKTHPATQATAGNRPYWIGTPRTLGSELVTNGRFATPTDWTTGTDWSYGASIASKTAGTASILSQAVSVVSGRTYLLVYNINRTAGTITPRLSGGTTLTGIARNAMGSYTDVFTANTNTTLEFSADAAFAGAVFNVTLKEVTSFVLPACAFVGSAFELTTAAFDCSGSDKGTMGVILKQDSATGNQEIGRFGAIASVNGSITIDMTAQPTARLRGSSGVAVSAVPTAEKGSGFSARDYCNIYEFDLAGAAIADQVKVRTRGILPTQTTSGVLAGANNFANAAVRLGITLRGQIGRFFWINRTLSTTERDNMQSWLMQGSVFGCVMGDSTVAITTAPVPNTQRVSDFVGGLVTGAADIAESGRRIADMLSFWNALADKSALQVVIVQIGLNDVKGRVGANTATSAEVIADYQALIDDIAADMPAGCRIHIVALTPCKVWLDEAVNAAAAYAAWQDLNEAIAGNGATPITGVHQRVTSHVAALNDGADNLLPIYDHEVLSGLPGGVHESNEARIIVAQAWRTALEADGLLEAA